MASAGNDGQTADIAQPPSRPVNLTAAAESMPWDKACKLIGVTGTNAANALDIRGVDHAEQGCLNDGSHETIYVVISGFGVLHSDGSNMECTAGDVLFVPRGCAHRFERLDGDIKIWRISAAAPDIAC